MQFTFSFQYIAQQAFSDFYLRMREASQLDFFPRTFYPSLTWFSHWLSAGDSIVIKIQAIAKSIFLEKLIYMIYFHDIIDLLLLIIRGCSLIIFVIGSNLDGCHCSDNTSDNSNVDLFTTPHLLFRGNVNKCCS